MQIRLSPRNGEYQHTIAHDSYELEQGNVKQYWERHFSRNFWHPMPIQKSKIILRNCTESEHFAGWVPDKGFFSCLPQDKGRISRPSTLFQEIVSAIHNLELWQDIGFIFILQKWTILEKSLSSIWLVINFFSST